MEHVEIFRIIESLRQLASESLSIKSRDDLLRAALLIESLLSEGTNA